MVKRKSKRKAPIRTPEQAQLEKDVKRINERINEIVKRYGTNSYAYNQYYAAVKSAFPENFRRIDKEGIIKISRSEALYKTAGSSETMQAITRILGLKTVGRLRREAVRSLKEEKAAQKKANKTRIKEGLPEVPEIQITPEAIKERQKEIDEVQSFVSENRDMFYVTDYPSEVNEIIHMKGRKKTYSELKTIVDHYKKGQHEYADIFEGL